MFEAIGNEVVHLKRISIGKLELGNLKHGEIQKTTKEHIMKAMEKQQ
jgi:16S rRNA U516 pseudouridylate synthase RsuA-like enzyme